MITTATVAAIESALGRNPGKVIQDHLENMHFHASKIGDLLNQRAVIVSEIIRKEKFAAEMRAEQSRVERTELRREIDNPVNGIDHQITERHASLVRIYGQLLAYGAPSVDVTLSIPPLPAVPASRGPVGQPELIKRMSGEAERTAAARSTFQPPAAAPVASADARVQLANEKWRRQSEINRMGR